MFIEMSKNAKIKPISSDTVHRICSGQVVVGLNIAVKELVENAIDAGANNIEIRLKNYGQEGVEVSDNGLGVEENNFAALTLKHYTSKLTEFDDLENVSTLGFRGEALSSLCALADLSIITRHETAEYGTKLEYDHNGHIKSQSITARSVGTSVQLLNLFATLPVRQKEFSKNCKREFNKMCTLLYAYCLVCSKIKFTCTNQVSNSKNIVVSTQGTGSISDNIVNVFGSKQSPNLVIVELVQADEIVAADFGIKNLPEKSPFIFDFRISSAAHGSGRSAADRQFYYINSRPCEPQKLIKLVNGIYRSFNNHQYPFVYLNVTVQSSLVDVNITPDKRQIFLEQEKLLMATVKMSLMEAFKTAPSTFKMQNLNISGQITPDEGKRKYEEVNVRPNMKSFLESFKKLKRGESNEMKIDVIRCPSTPKNKQKSQAELVQHEVECNATESQIEQIDKTAVLIYEFIKTEETPLNNAVNVSPKGNEENVSNQSTGISKNLNETTNYNGRILEPIPARPKAKTKVVFDEPSEDNDDNVDVHTVPLDFTIDSIRNAIQASALVVDKDEDLVVKFRAEIAPSSNKDAEQELEKQFSKDMFKQMRIIGQFNYGFIVASLDQDLFIIDQHASDEKYNFEMLQRNTIIESQILVNPKPLQLTSVDEAILKEYEKLFNKNGFYFKHDPKGTVTERVKLTKIPVSRSTIFGKDDIDEMIYMLKEGADSNCRPSRIRGMFASRACRKSVMIGKALNKSAMKKLVDHMGDIDQPWNCPHGRPTMRHLINMQLLQ